MYIFKYIKEKIKNVVDYFFKEESIVLKTIDVNKYKKNIIIPEELYKNYYIKYLKTNIKYKSRICVTIVFIDNNGLKISKSWKSILIDNDNNLRKHINKCLIETLDIYIIDKYDSIYLNIFDILYDES